MKHVVTGPVEVELSRVEVADDANVGAVVPLEVTGVAAVLNGILVTPELLTPVESELMAVPVEVSSSQGVLVEDDDGR